MSKFAIKSIEALGDNEAFKQVVVYRNSEEIDLAKIESSKGVLDIYEETIQKIDLTSYKKILTYMDYLASNPNTLLPKTIYNPLTPKNDPVAEFELKHQKLRVYGIITMNKVSIIVHCGFKNNQKEDIIRFRSLKKQFLEQSKKY